MEDRMRIAIFPDAFEPGWDGDPNSLNTLLFADHQTLEDFTREQDTDAMAVSYLVPQETRQPRLNLPALAALKAAGQEPELHWAIFDIDNPGHTPWTDIEDAENAVLDAFDALPEALFSSVGGYTTRAGFRLMWKLEPALPVGMANSFLRNLGVWLEEMGLAVDSASYEWTRFFRLPRAKRDGTVLKSYVDLGPIEEGRSLDPLKLSAENKWALQTDSTCSTPTGDLPEEPMELTFDQWLAAWKYPYLKLGRPLPAQDGHTYPVLRSVLASIAATGDVRDPETLVAYVWSSVEATPNLSLDDAWKLASWVCDRQEAKEETKYTGNVPPIDPPKPDKYEWERVRAAFRGRNSSYFNRLRDGVPLTPHKDRLAECTYHIVRLLAEKGRVPDANMLYRYVRGSVFSTQGRGPTPQQVWDKCREVIDDRETDEEAVRTMFCAEHPLTIKQVGKGGRLFQLDTTTSPYKYISSDNDCLLLHYKKYTEPNLPFVAEYEATTPLGVILNSYGASVDKAVFVSGQDGTLYDSDAGIIMQGVHQLVASKAVHHEDIAEWLFHLGGDDVDGLLDWLAAVTYTGSEPICALYLEGPPGIGKSLIIHGIASLWGSAPCDYNQITGGFNGGLLTCPLLGADEGITYGKFAEHNASEIFRNYVANSSHFINQKHKQPATLNASLRVIVCSNDENGIPFRKALGKDGIDAIVERILHINTGPGTRAYLDKLGGRKGVRDWIKPSNQPGRLAEHLLWLRETRKLEGQGRFLVSGKMSPWHRQFVADQGYKPAVLTVISKLLGLASGGYAASNVWVKPDIDEGVVWINAGAVYEHWESYAGISRPKATTIANTVKMLADGEVRQLRFGEVRKRCWPINFQSFVDAMICEWGDHGYTERTR
tara:strand:- start:6120 stop:8768 length:2649 start_codon:yes stop_codon:yes gene_type:complete